MTDSICGFRAREAGRERARSPDAPAGSTASPFPAPSGGGACRRAAAATCCGRGGGARGVRSNEGKRALRAAWWQEARRRRSGHARGERGRLDHRVRVVPALLHARGGGVRSLKTRQPSEAAAVSAHLDVLRRVLDELRLRRPVVASRGGGVDGADVLVLSARRVGRGGGRSAWRGGLLLGLEARPVAGTRPSASCRGGGERRRAHGGGAAGLNAANAAAAPAAPAPPNGRLMPCEASNAAKSI